MRIQSYLIVRDNFKNLPRSDFYMSALDNTKRMMEFSKVDLHLDFSSLDSLRLEYILNIFIFNLNHQGFNKNKYCYTFLYNESDMINAIQIFQILS